jgi:type I restriction enzyme S subunit
VIRTRYLATISTGSGDTQDAKPDGEYPFYVRSDTPLRSSKFEFDGPAVLTAGDGAGVGKVFHLVSGKFMAHQRVYVLHDFGGILPAYFKAFFETFFRDVALDGSAKSTVDSVRRPMIADMPITVPPVEEQRTIIETLEDETSKIDALITKAQAFIDLAKERRSALITAAVTGQIDVTEVTGG